MFYVKYIFIVILVGVFTGCLSDESSDTNSVSSLSKTISDTKSLQPDVKAELQPPRPPAL